MYHILLLNFWDRLSCFLLSFIFYYTHSFIFSLFYSKLFCVIINYYPAIRNDNIIDHKNCQTKKLALYTIKVVSFYPFISVYNFLHYKWILYLSCLFFISIFFPHLSVTFDTLSAFIV